MRERSVRLLVIAGMVITVVSALQLVSSNAEGQDLEVGTHAGPAVTTTSEPDETANSERPDDTADDRSPEEPTEDPIRVLGKAEQPCLVTTFAEPDSTGTELTYETGSYDLRSSQAGRVRSIEVSSCTATLCEFEASLGACSTFEAGEHDLPSSLSANVGFLSVTAPPSVESATNAAATQSTDVADIQDQPAGLSTPAIPDTEPTTDPAPADPAASASSPASPIPAPAPKEEPITVTLPPTCEIQRAQDRTVTIVMKHHPEGARIRRAGFRNAIASAGPEVVDTNVPFGRQDYEMVAGGRVVTACGTTTIAAPKVAQRPKRTGSVTNPTECAVLLIGGRPIVSWRGAVNATSYRIWRNGEAITQVQSEKYTDRSATLANHKYHYAVVSGELNDTSRVYCGFVITN